MALKDFMDLVVEKDIKNFLMVKKKCVLLGFLLITLSLVSPFVGTEKKQDFSSDIKLVYYPDFLQGKTIPKHTLVISKQKATQLSYYDLAYRLFSIVESLTSCIYEYNKIVVYKKINNLGLERSAEDIGSLKVIQEVDPNNLVVTKPTQKELTNLPDNTMVVAFYKEDEVNTVSSTPGGNLVEERNAKENALKKTYPGCFLFVQSGLAKSTAENAGISTEKKENKIRTSNRTEESSGYIIIDVNFNSVTIQKEHYLLIASLLILMVSVIRYMMHTYIDIERIFEVLDTI